MDKSKNVVLDTNILIDFPEVITKYDKPIILSCVFEELDNLAHDKKKGSIVKKAIKEIIKNKDNVVFIDVNLTFFPQTKIDNKLLAFCKENNARLVTNDAAMILKAEQYYDVEVESWFGEDKNEESAYVGYKEITLSEYEQAVHYECSSNKWDLLENEYLIIKDSNNNIVDKQRWTCKGFVPVLKKPLKSLMFGDIKPKDVYQELAIDSLINSDFTILTGSAGSAKTLLSLGYIMQMLQNGKIDKCIIAHNPVNLAGSQALGFYPGDRNQKILSTSLGGILSSKFGDPMIVESLISQGKLFLIPASDIRGFEVGEKNCLFVTEGQNLDIYTLKTVLQRVKEGCKVIVEGDISTQIDAKNCSEENNGMRKAIEIFKGEKEFSCVELKNIYRSNIANIAQKM
jgi:PhoH-like ATPase